MWIQKAEIINGKINFNKLGIVKLDELEPGIADNYYVHEQNVASEVWNVVHNLRKNPSVTIVDNSGVVVYGRIEYISANELKIYFKYPFAGKAYCN